jgi:exopolysaccharide biosynthesis polyprenyl glycosylphosphotransferase
MSTDVLPGEPGEVKKTSEPGELKVPKRKDWQWLNLKSVKELLFVSGDTFVVVISHTIARVIAAHVFRVPVADLDPEGYEFFYLPFLTVTLYLLNGYTNPDLRRSEKELALIFKAVPLSFLMMVCANFIFWRELGFSRYLIGSWATFCLLLLFVERFGLRSLYSLLWKHGLARQRAVLIGSPEKLARYRRVLSIQRHSGYDLLGVIPAGNHNKAVIKEIVGLDMLGPLRDWQRVSLQVAAQLVVVSLPATEEFHKLTLDIVRHCQEHKMDVEVFSDLFSCSEFGYELDEFSGFFRFYAVPRFPRGLERGIKALLETAIGLIGTAVTLFITPLVGFLIKLEDGGPIFYRREFVGCDGNVHYYLKFRTMLVNAEQILQKDPELKAKFAANYKLENDPRLLRVGQWLRKYSIDEFPQFFSLLIGKLALVGPRVIASDEKERYGALLQKRLSVKPGMTGFWQVMGRQTTTYDERVDMDMFYIDHWSIWLDLVIIGRTFWKVLRAEGAY